MPRSGKAIHPHAELTSQEFTEEQYRLYYTGKLKQCSVYTIPTSTIGTLASEITLLTTVGLPNNPSIAGSGTAAQAELVMPALGEPGFWADAGRWTLQFGQPLAFAGTQHPLFGDGADTVGTDDRDLLAVISRLVEVGLAVVRREVGSGHVFGEVEQRGDGLC